MPTGNLTWFEKTRGGGITRRGNGFARTVPWLGGARQQRALLDEPAAG